MSNEKDESSGWNKKKFLYLDRFIKHQEADSEWKKTAMKRIKDIDRILMLLFIVSIVALIIAIVK